MKGHFFHVVPNDFKIRTDGVIGRGLMVELKVNIDYGDRILRIGLNKIPLYTPERIILPKLEQVMEIFLDKNGIGDKLNQESLYQTI